MDNKELRRKILEYIYQKNEEKPRYMANREELKESLDINDAKLDNNVLYLEGKGYLKLMKGIGAFFFHAKITSMGIDLVENPKEFNKVFPIQITQNVIRDNIGVIIGNDNVQTISNIENFKPIYNEIEKRNPPNKEKIISEVKTIEGEVKKEAPNQSIISKSIKYLKENASWIVPSILLLIKGTIGT